VEFEAFGVGVGDWGESVTDDGGGKLSILPWGRGGRGKQPTRERSRQRERERKKRERKRKREKKAKQNNTNRNGSRKQFKNNN
jgi:hypothetical protein